MLCLGGVHGYFFNYYYYHVFLCFRVACAVIVKYYYYCEFCFCFGWCARLFFKITNTITSFGFFRVACAVIFNYHYYHEFCFFFRMVCAVIFNYCYYCEFCLFVFGWCDRLFLITITNTSFVVRVVCTVHFELLQIGPIVCQSLHKQREEAIVDVNVHEDFLAAD